MFHFKMLVCREMICKRVTKCSFVKQKAFLPFSFGRIRSHPHLGLPPSFLHCDWWLIFSPWAGLHHSLGSEPQVKWHRWCSRLDAAGESALSFFSPLTATSWAEKRNCYFSDGPALHCVGHTGPSHRLVQLMGEVWEPAETWMGTFEKLEREGTWLRDAD